MGQTHNLYVYKYTSRLILYYYKQQYWQTQYFVTNMFTSF